MELFCIGLSHKSSPVALRERLALAEAGQVEVLRRLSLQGFEALWVSTCNRVELYVAASEPERARQEAVALFEGLGGPDALPHLYEHRADDAIVHLFRVAASLDSMVLGEAQILGQVKDAYELAQREGAIRGELTRACAAAFSSAKRVRTETAIGRAATSMASAAVQLAGKIFGGLEDKAVLLVGAGEMAELSAKHLQQAGATQIAVTNRTAERAAQLAAAIGATSKPFEELGSLLIWADVVLCSTASPTPIFTREKVAKVLKARKHRPLFMVDLAVPRDIEPEVNALDGVFAYDVDDIQKVVAENSAVRAEEASKAEVIIAQEVARFSSARAVREGVPVLAQLRARAEQIARAELDRTLGRLGDELAEKHRKSLEAMAMAIVNKLLHQPTAKLRAVNPAEEGGRLAEAAAELFGLEPEDAPDEDAGETPSAAVVAKR